MNKDDNFLYRVTYAAAFGSYVNTERETIGDLDIAFRLEPKGEGEDFKKRCDLKSDECRSSNWFLYKTWPREEVLRYLKNKSGYISLHSYDQDIEAVESGEKLVLFTSLIVSNNN